MNHFEQQIQDDREVFHEFCSSPGGPGANWHSVDHGDDRTTPDIMCTSECGDTTFFALTQVDPKELHDLVAWSRSDQRKPSSRHYGLSTTEWALFRTKYHGSVLDLGEPKECVHPDKAVQRVFKYLLKRDPWIDYPLGSDGEMFIPYDDITPHGELDASQHRLHQGNQCQSVWILSGVRLVPMSSVEDPEIWHGAVAPQREFALSPIAEECKKQYRDESGRSLRPESFHLVLWTDVGSSGLVDETSEYLESANGRAEWEPVFGSVWLFDRVHQRIAYHALGPGNSD